ncbi:MAG: PD40 domain-containing protein, partial [Caldilineaceae bacterium]|nr:PD40 domain-containing protein [Caldilineaceae bacterium]
NQAGIVYQSDAGLQITSAAPDATNRLLAFDYLKPFYRDPDWQPDGGQVVFQSQEGSHWEIFVINPDGTGMTALTRPATALVDVLPSNVAPAWSPDGATIAFLSNRDADHEAGAWRLWVMRADGSDQRPLDIPVNFDYTFASEQILDWGP